MQKYGGVANVASNIDNNSVGFEPSQKLAICLVATEVNTDAAV